MLGPRTRLTGLREKAMPMDVTVSGNSLVPAFDSGQAEVYRSVKFYDHSEGLSCCFRQWRAKGSHCRLVHGYALAFRFVFATRELDERNWCFDFGGLKPIRAWLHQMFDHTLLVAEDDPARAEMERLGEAQIADLRILPAVGCEAIARYAFDHVEAYVHSETAGRSWLESVEVREHGGNAAIFEKITRGR